MGILTDGRGIMRHRSELLNVRLLIYYRMKELNLTLNMGNKMYFSI